MRVWEVRGLGFHGAAATGSCESPEMDSGNPTRALREELCTLDYRAISQLPIF